MRRQLSRGGPCGPPHRRACRAWHRRHCPGETDGQLHHVSPSAPTPTPKCKKCIYSVTKSGEVVLGSKKVPIVNPVAPAGRLRRRSTKTNSPNSSPPPTASPLSKTAQPVPGGLAGLVNCKEIKDFFLRIILRIDLRKRPHGSQLDARTGRPAERDPESAKTTSPAKKEWR